MTASIELWIYDFPNLQKTVEQRHTDIVHEMTRLGPPLGWNGLTAPVAPVRGKGDLASYLTYNYPAAGIVFKGRYAIRDAKYLYDSKACDEHFAFQLPSRNFHTQYQSLLTEHFPAAIAAIGGYRAAVYSGTCDVNYADLHATERQALHDRGDIDVDGRNNIFTLNSAHYWDAGLCQRALGYGRDEVIRRLEGKVPLVKPLMDGVYVVFSDNPDLTFEEYCAYNDRLKPILGLV